VDDPTLDAARRELQGEVVRRRSDGTPFDHVTKVQQGQEGLLKRITQLQLGDTRTTEAQRPALEAELSEASRLLDHSEQFVPRP
jgi:Bacterial toxin 28